MSPWEWIFVFGGAALGSVAYFIWRWRNPGFQRQRRLRKSTSREQWRRVAIAVRRGEAVPDPRDAAVAAEYAENARLMRSGWLGSPVAFRIELALFATLALVWSIMGDSYLLSALVIAFVILMAGRLASDRVRRRIDTAAERNRRLAQRFEGTSGPTKRSPRS